MKLKQVIFAMVVSLGAVITAHADENLSFNVTHTKPGQEAVTLGIHTLPGFDAFNEHYESKTVPKETKQGNTTTLSGERLLTGFGAKIAVQKVDDHAALIDLSYTVKQDNVTVAEGTKSLTIKHGESVEVLNKKGETLVLYFQ